VQPLSFKTIVLSTPPRIYLGVVIATSLVYLLLDLVPIFKLFPDVELRIIQVLWQTLLWTLYSVFIAFFIGHGLGVGLKMTQDSFWTFCSKNILEYLSAKLRVLIKSTLWGLLFIIPGFIMAIRYSLNEMVIFYSPDFLEDRTQDPLEISARKISTFSPALIALVGLYFLLPAFFDASFDHAHFQYEPYPRLFQIALYSVLNLATYIYLFKLFLNFKETQYV
jgi:hypothetical protein